ncbi:hypothetical protein A3709_09215 [Halioglobus sp. HI00S01]|uniref:hypothetical protein n=1 Tax=Halioglobus sp. HI00S01 TaxID=1822214 RepID=UPI0007C381F6|nr:hypothetical protein [Halioglobus sp. HI00S01]KZX55154.1 hypothetical protein A3709_09215 [Halioglobus sp. HI00S01]
MTTFVKLFAVEIFPNGCNLLEEPVIINAKRIGVLRPMGAEYKKRFQSAADTYHATASVLPGSLVSARELCWQVLLGVLPANLELVSTGGSPRSSSTYWQGWPMMSDEKPKVGADRAPINNQEFLEFVFGKEAWVWGCSFQGDPNGKNVT